ncbi:hypothetical protein BJ742DRAFT_474941 [Cladochytrium replicatum]|nr:hypothetical protein BJ742DRAFT_474941 [Cladochytrium replicatum]
MGILGMIDDSMIDKDGIKCDYKKPKQDTFASFLQAMPINVLMDAFATTAPPPDMIGSADSSRLSFFGFIERTMSIVGGSRTFLKLEEAERVLTRAHPINSTGDHLQQVPGEPELPVLPSFDPSQGVTMHASIVPVIGTSDHGYSAAANFASGMMSFAGLIGRKMTNQYVLHYIFAASKLLRVDYEAMSWGAVQIFKFQERRKPGLLNDIVNTYKTIGEFFQQGYREGDIYLPLFYGPQVKHKRIWLPSGAVLAGQGSWPDWIDGATRDVLEGRIFLVLMGNSECDNKLNFPTPSKCWAVCERVHGPRGFVVRKVGVFHSIETHSESTSNYVHHFQGWVTVA